MTPPTAAVSRRSRKRRATEVAVALAPMQQDWSNLDPNDLSSPALFINRELSWLAFNERVLAQAQDISHPLLERVKFLAITGTNLDEFFMVRVATILKKFRAGIEDVSIDGQTTDPQLATIRARPGTDRRSDRVLEPVTAAVAGGGRHSFSRADRLHAGHRCVADAVLQGPHLSRPDAFGVRPGPSVPVYLEPEHEPGGARASR